MIVVRRRRTLARMSGAGADQRDGASNDGAEQRQKYDGLVHTPSALHQIHVLNRDRAAVAEVSNEDRKPDGGFGSRHREHDQRIDLADDVAEECRERDQIDVDREQDELNRHQDDDDVLTVEKDTEDPERKQDRGDPEIMPQPDHESPCPDFTLTISMAVERRRPTCWA